MRYHYLLCDAAGHVNSIQTLDCASDDEAHVRAVKMLPSSGISAIEVWQGPRRVDRVEGPLRPGERRAN